MLAKPQVATDCNYLSDRVFDGTRPVAADDVARLRARYKDHIASVKKDGPDDRKETSK